MFERIEIFDKRYAELNRRLYEPDVAANPDEYQRVIKEIKSIEEIVLTYRDYKGALQTERDSLEILNDNSDPELKELAQLELEEAKEKIEAYFKKEGGNVAKTDDGSVVAIFYANTFGDLPTGDAELEKIEINLTIKEWSVK